MKYLIYTKAKNDAKSFFNGIIFIALICYVFLTTYTENFTFSSFWQRMLGTEGEEK